MTSFRSHLITLIVGVTFAVTFLYGLLTWSGAAPWGGGYEMKVMFPTAGAMGPGATVRISGMKVGKVTSVERRGAAAVLGLRINDAATPIPEDSRAAVRLRTLVGENYVEIVPGRSRRGLPDGGILPMSQTDDYVEADEILSVLRGKTRERARTFINGVGAGLEGRGQDLNTTLKGTAGMVQEADDVTAILANDHEQVAGLVEHVGDVMREIGDRSASVKELATSGRQTFRALAERDEALVATLRELPSTLEQVRTTSRVVGSVSGASTPVINGLAGAVTALAPAVTTLRPAAQQGREIMKRLSTAAPRLTKTAAALRTLGAPSAAALPELRKVLCELNPMAEYLEPFSKDVSAMLANMASSTNYYDATGHAARFYALVGQNSFTAIPDAGREALNTLQDIGIVNQLTKRGYQPYPAPGDGGVPKGGEGASGPLDSKLPYTRVEAEC